MLHTIDYGIFSKVYGPLFRHDRFLLVLGTFLLEYILVLLPRRLLSLVSVMCVSV